MKRTPIPIQSIGWRRCIEVKDRFIIDESESLKKSVFSAVPKNMRIHAISVDDGSWLR